jgi:hypothetical protein
MSNRRLHGRVNRFFQSLLFFLALTLLIGFSNHLVAATPDDDAPFTLQNLPEDSPDTLKYKAALRLFGGARAVFLICGRCKDQATWSAYEKRNGNTMAFVAKKMKAYGGLRNEQKEVLNDFSNETADKAVSFINCGILISQINGQKWDLYRSERFVNDYNFLKE